MSAAQNFDILTRLNRIMSGADERDLDETECRAIRDAADEIKRLRDERDEARRLYCEEAFAHRFNERRFNERGGLGPITDPKQIAQGMKWDCFKEDTND